MQKVNRKTFNEGELETLCRIIADTNDGLTGSQIEYFLRMLNFKDIDPTLTKWKRLYNALANRQNQTNSGNCVLSFISKSFAPSRYIGNKDFYDVKLEKINTILLFHGLEFKDDGKFHKVRSTNTLTEAENRASRLTERITSRHLHPHLLKYCKKELLQNNYFHAVLEATKSIASMIRTKTGLESDGAKLVEEAFGGSNPLLKINSLKTESEISEQKGFVNLAKGLFGTFRNPTAHAAKIEWNMSEEDSIDLFTLASYVLRRIENSN
ncbi:TIGR02391 family protein [Evansella halocellulosilytica]|uniref:TIGR02391 family protein n=1 Tax=Evansella halocellulosilytica TaxID=2011013 RepID=UPI000BB99C58|nr:TIGR02391 family protein [Evansella halocellulosilytica]